MKRIAALSTVILIAGVANAQAAGPTNPGSPAPNAYSRASQPLSPYLNLLRGGNTAVNYFYGVRPGTQTGAFNGMFSQAGPRQTFFPGADTLADLVDDPRDIGKVGPTGHPAGFDNTLNYFGPTSGQFFARGAHQQRKPGR
jgi:hypothetical protein